MWSILQLEMIIIHRNALLYLMRLTQGCSRFNYRETFFAYRGSPDKKAGRFPMRERVGPAKNPLPRR